MEIAGDHLGLPLSRRSLAAQLPPLAAAAAGCRPVGRSSNLCLFAALPPAGASCRRASGAWPLTPWACTSSCSLRATIRGGLRRGQRHGAMLLPSQPSWLLMASGAKRVHRLGVAVTLCSCPVQLVAVAVQLFMAHSCQPTTPRNCC